MREILEEIWTYLPGSDYLVRANIQSVAEGEGVWVRGYAELVEKIASIAFKNPQWLLFFRGQKQDHKEGNATTLLPAIFRNQHGDLRDRYESLKRAENLLKVNYHFDGEEKIRIHEILRWAILQHYEIHTTPLLDVTYSPRVACSFSRIEDSSEPSYVYVLGLPQISGSISVSSEHEIQNIRLLSVCPPAALRPHYQEGHLIGDYPTLGYDEKTQIHLREVDFNRRLMCKFKLEPSGDFQTIRKKFLFPGNCQDRVGKMAEEIRSQLEPPA